MGSLHSGRAIGRHAPPSDSTRRDPPSLISYEAARTPRRHNISKTGDRRPLAGTERDSLVVNRATVSGHAAASIGRSLLVGLENFGPAMIRPRQCEDRNGGGDALEWPTLLNASWCGTDYPYPPRGLLLSHGPDIPLSLYRVPRDSISASQGRRMPPLPMMQT